MADPGWDGPWPFASRVVRLEEAASTNDLGKDLGPRTASDELPLVLVADRQTAGRGRGSNAWWSDGGSLTFSIVLEPGRHGIRPEHEPRMALAAGLAVAMVAEEMVAGLGVGIRWPNDVEVGGRKLAGILVERVQGDLGPRMVVGIGLNVRTRFDLAPEDVRALGISLADLSPEFGAGDQRAVALARVLEQYEIQLGRLAAEEDTFIDDLNARDQLAGTVVRIEQGEALLEGEGRGIARDGALLLEIEGEVRAIYGGRVRR